MKNPKLPQFLLIMVSLFAGNVFSSGAQVSRYDLLISEIHPAPNDQTLLPNVEWVEIFNASGRPVQLEGFVFSDGTRSVKLPPYILEPEAYLVLAPKAGISKLQSYGAAAGISPWPSLNNNADILSLYNRENYLIDRVAYSKSWYQSSVKAKGGWSLERIDLNTPCAGASNWLASGAAAGGTPSGVNSVSANKPDNMGPELLLIFVQDSLNIRLLFNEATDTTKLSGVSAELRPKIPGINLFPVADEPESLLLRLNAPLTAGQEYQLDLSGLTDCSGNLMEPLKGAAVAFPLNAGEGDVVLNEVMYDPVAGSDEWIEIANATDYHLNLQNWQLATWEGGIKSSVILSREPLLLAPHGFLVITSNMAAVKSAFPSAPDNNFLQLPAIPALPNTGDTLVLLSPDGRIAERFGYHKGLHSSFIKERKGISLERISQTAPADHAGNWTSAAAAVNYGTPGMPNSQQFDGKTAPENLLLVEPEVITPGSASSGSFAVIRYKAPQAGLQATLRIFDTEGREIKTLAKNELAGAEGFYTWDGTAEDESRVRMGYYVVLLHLYGQNGYNRIFRKTVVVGIY